MKKVYLEPSFGEIVHYYQPLTKFVENSNFVENSSCLTGFQRKF